MLFFLIGYFSAVEIVVFYIFFEASLIPIFIIILGWGYQPERLRAGVYLVVYIVLASLPLLAIVLALSGGAVCSFLGFADLSSAGLGVILLN